jgi:hypothetical protein
VHFKHVHLYGACYADSCTLYCAGPMHRLAPLYPEQLMVGMEIRDKVATYVRERIGALARPSLSSQIAPATIQQQHL